MYSVAASHLVCWFAGWANGLPLAMHRRAWFPASKCDVWVCRVEGVVVGVVDGVPSALSASFQRLFGVPLIDGWRLVVGWLEDGRRMVGGRCWLRPNVTYDGQRASRTCAVAAKPQTARRPTLSAKRAAAAKIGPRVPKGRGRNEPAARRKARRRRPQEKAGWGREAARRPARARRGRSAVRGLPRPNVTCEGWVQM